MATMTISSKGQIVLSADIRRRFGLMAGTQIEIIENQNGLRLVPTHSVQSYTLAACSGMIKRQSEALGRF